MKSLTPEEFNRLSPPERERLQLEYIEEYLHQREVRQAEYKAKKEAHKKRFGPSK